MFLSQIKRAAEGRARNSRSACRCTATRRRENVHDHGFLVSPIHTPVLVGVWYHRRAQLLHVQAPVPSVSGQAVLTMPVMAPLCDLLEISRDAGVIAYQTGAGLMDLITPTNGALLAVLLAAAVPYGRWIRFAVPGALLVSIVGLVGIALAR
ncbi:MAG TPA: hypothetical protein VFZ73_03230 [Gemmatimonadaceae bacterium]